jgi:hypothetical protein
MSVWPRRFSASCTSLQTLLGTRSPPTSFSFSATLLPHSPSAWRPPAHWTTSSPLFRATSPLIPATSKQPCSSPPPGAWNCVALASRRSTSSGVRTHAPHRLGDDFRGAREHLSACGPTTVRAVVPRHAARAPAAAWVPTGEGLLFAYQPLQTCSHCGIHLVNHLSSTESTLTLRPTDAQMRQAPTLGRSDAWMLGLSDDQRPLKLRFVLCALILCSIIHALILLCSTLPCSDATMVDTHMTLGCFETQTESTLMLRPTAAQMHQAPTLGRSDAWTPPKLRGSEL